MNNTIQVLRSIRAYEDKSLSDAVTVSIDKDGLNKPKFDLINGRKAVRYKFNGFKLVITFENGMYLIVSPGDNLIEWDIVSVEPEIGNEEDLQNIFFEFENGNKISWDWKRILDSFIGKQVAISPSKQYLFIFAKDGDEYMFDAYKDFKNKNVQYLVISET